jgi:hypothetical protein
MLENDNSCTLLKGASSSVLVCMLDFDNSYTLWRGANFSVLVKYKMFKQQCFSKILGEMAAFDGGFEEPAQLEEAAQQRPTQQSRPFVHVSQIASEERLMHGTQPYFVRESVRQFLPCFEAWCVAQERTYPLRTAQQQFYLVSSNLLQTNGVRAKNETIERWHAEMCLARLQTEEVVRYWREANAHWAESTVAKLETFQQIYREAPQRYFACYGFAEKPWSEVECIAIIERCELHAAMRAWGPKVLKQVPFPQRMSAYLSYFCSVLCCN